MRPVGFGELMARKRRKDIAKVVAITAGVVASVILIVKRGGSSDV